MWNMTDPHNGPRRKPIPVAVSISPMFCILSDLSEVDTTIAIDATALLPEPRPPSTWAMKEKVMNQFSL